MREYKRHVIIDAPALLVLDAFFDHPALATWWRVSRSLCVPRMLGCYALEWPTTTERDELLGPLGGTLHGTIIDYKPGRELFVADVYWLPPSGDPIGPMALEITCTPHDSRTILDVRHSGWSDSPRWNRYYDIVDTGLTMALEELKGYLEVHTR